MFAVYKTFKTHNRKNQIKIFKSMVYQPGQLVSFPIRSNFVNLSDKDLQKNFRSENYYELPPGYRGYAHLENLTLTTIISPFLGFYVEDWQKISDSSDRWGKENPDADISVWNETSQRRTYYNLNYKPARFKLSDSHITDLLKYDFRLSVADPMHPSLYKELNDDKLIGGDLYAGVILNKKIVYVLMKCVTLL